jgi:hypothetical protein
VVGEGERVGWWLFKRWDEESGDVSRTWEGRRMIGQWKPSFFFVDFTFPSIFSFLLKEGFMQFLSL